MVAAPIHDRDYPMPRMIFLAILLCSSLCFAELYYWIDANGVKHVSDTKPDTDAPTLETRQEAPHTPEPPPQAAAPRTATTTESFDQEETKVAKPGNDKRNKDVVMYSTQRCGYCRQARKFFKTHGVQYTEYDVGTSKEALAKFKELKGEGVPLIYIGEQRIAGFNEPVMKDLLGLK